MSLSLAGGHRTPSAVNTATPVLASSISGVLANTSGIVGSGFASSSVFAPSPAPAPPGLAAQAVSPIVQTVERRLRESSYYYLRSIRCGYESGVVTLRGRVPTFYLKQTVQAIVEKIEGVEQVVNLVEVFDSRRMSPPLSAERPDALGTLARMSAAPCGADYARWDRPAVTRPRPRYFFSLFRCFSSQSYMAASAFSASAPRSRVPRLRVSTARLRLQRPLGDRASTSPVRTGRCYPSCRG